MARRELQRSERNDATPAEPRPWVNTLGMLVDRADGAFERRVVSRPSMVVLIELFAGLGWTRACVEKIVDGDWWRGEVVREFAADHQGLGLPWYEGLQERLVDFAPVAVALGVLAVEVVIAVCLVAGRRLVLAVGLGIALLMQFLLAGAVNPAVFYLIFHSALGLWAVERLEPSKRLLASLRGAALLCIVVVAVTLPFARTMAPAEVIEDPALVVAAWGTCSAISLVGARRRIRRRYLEVTTIDLRDVLRSRTR